MNSVTFLVGFILAPLLVFLVLVIFAEERAKEIKKKLSDYYKKELDEGIEGLSKIKTRYNR